MLLAGDVFILLWFLCRSSTAHENNSRINLKNAHRGLHKVFINGQARVQSVNPSIKIISDKESIDCWVRATSITYLQIN